MGRSKKGEPMAVLGKGNAHGACSLLHAAPLGYGANIALDLPITVRLLDRPSKREVKDDDGVLSALLTAWIEAKYPLPEGFEREDLHWGVNSKIPKKQGLKSSAATCIAALRALCKATETHLDPHEMVALAAQAQTSSEVSITGSIDDAWACMSPGWKLIDIQAPIAEGVLMDEPGLSPEDWTVLLVLRGPRTYQPTLEDFASQTTAFQQALNALQEGNPLVAMTWNGRGSVAALRDVEGRKMANDSFMNSARAAGISGSGPALVIVVPAQQTPTVERIKSWYSTRYPEAEIIETSFLSNEIEDELE
jgi:shikimate kinase